MKSLNEIFGQLEKYELGTDKAKFFIPNDKGGFTGFICGKARNGGILTEIWENSKPTEPLKLSNSHPSIEAQWPIEERPESNTKF